MPNRWRVLVVGSTALDDIETPHGKMERVLGGSAVYASCSASKYAQTALVGVVGEDFPEEHISFLERQGINVAGLQKKEGKTFHWKGSYHGSMDQADTHDTRLGVFEAFSPDIPEALRSYECLILGNIHPALQLRILEQMESPKVVGADTMNFWIDGEPALLRRLIEKVKVMFINEAEIRSLTGKSSLLCAADSLLEMGPETVVLKRGEHGMSVHRRRGWISFVPAYPTRDVRDPTGAGDSLAGGMMGYVASRCDLSPETFRMAGICGTVASSFAIEGFGPFRLASSNENERDERIHKIMSMLGMSG